MTNGKIICSTPETRFVAKAFGAESWISSRSDGLQRKLDGKPATHALAVRNSFGAVMFEFFGSLDEARAAEKKFESSPMQQIPGVPKMEFAIVSVDAQPEPETSDCTGNDTSKIPLGKLNMTVHIRDALDRYRLAVIQAEKLRAEHDAQPLATADQEEEWIAVGNCPFIAAFQFFDPDLGRRLAVAQSKEHAIWKEIVEAVSGETVKPL